MCEAIDRLSSYPCHLCSKVYRTSRDWKLHINSHLLTKPYVCAYCDDGFSQPEQLTRHLRSCNQNKNQLATDNNNMRSQQQQMPLAGFVRPEDVNISSLQLELVHNPFIFHSDAIQADSAKAKPIQMLHECTACSRSFLSREDLSAHMKSHIKPKIGILGRVLSMENGIAKLVDSPESEKLTNNNHTCGICNKGFRYNSMLQQHFRLVHTNDKPYYCNICDRSFKRSEYLHHHMRSHTGEKPYKCDVCERKFTKSCTLKTHMRLHSGEKPYKCDLCQLSFAQASGLKAHKLVHTKDRPYKCNVCNKAFSCWTSRSVHLKSHTRERDEMCEICGKTFKHVEHLKRHTQTHISGEMERSQKQESTQAVVGETAVHTESARKKRMLNQNKSKCFFCLNSFKTTATLLKHLRNHIAILCLPQNKSTQLKRTQRKPVYRCLKCDKHFSHALILNGHMMKHLN